MCSSRPSMKQLPRDEESWLDTTLEHPLGIGVSTAVAPPRRAALHPTPPTSALQKVQPPYQLLRVGASKQDKQDVPQQRWGADESRLAREPAKYARAAGFAFGFLWFINVCIYLLFSPRVGREEGEAGSLQWDKLGGADVLSALLSTVSGVGFLWFSGLFSLFLYFILLFKPSVGVVPCLAPPQLSPLPKGSCSRIPSPY